MTRRAMKIVRNGCGGLSSPPGGLKGRLQPGLAATRGVFSRADAFTTVSAC